MEQEKMKLNEEVLRLKKVNNFNNGIIIAELIILAIVVAVAVFVRCFL